MVEKMRKTRKMVEIKETILTKSLIFILYHYYNINNIILVYKIDTNFHNTL